MESSHDQPYPDYLITLTYVHQTETERESVFFKVFVQEVLSL